MKRQQQCSLILGMMLMMVGWGLDAAAEIVPAGPRFQVSESGSDPAVAFDADGRALVVWIGRTDTETPDVSRLSGRLFEPDGQPAGESYVIDDVTDIVNLISLRDPDVAAVGPGQFVVVWSSWDFEGSEKFDVFGRLTGDQPSGPRFRINNLRRFWQIDPAVAAGRDGDFFVAWTVSDVGDQGPAWPRILGARRFSGEGTPAGRELQVNRLDTSPTDLDAYDRTVASATNGAGETLVAWVSLSGVFARRYSHQGRPLGPEVLIDSYSHIGFQVGEPAVAAGANGHFLVSWVKAGRVMARTLNRRGVAGPASVISSGSAGEPAFLAVASDAAGFVVVWRASTDYEHERIVLRQLTPDARPRGGVVAVSPGYRADVAASPGGDLLVVWQARGPEPGVLGRRFRDD